MTLVRRGYRTPEQARAFLAADESHPPVGLRLDGRGRRAGAARDRGRAADHGPRRLRRRRRLRDGDHGRRPARAGRRVRLVDPRPARRRLRAQRRERRASWPSAAPRCCSRSTAGSPRSTEVALAQGAGHGGRSSPTTTSPAPSCRTARSCIPQVSGYPFESLCGTAVAWKLGLRAAGQRGGSRRARDDLDLVALATVADVVPLVGENRSLVRGLAEMRRAQRPGMRALMAAAEVRARAAGRGRPGIPAGAADQRRRAALPGRCRGRAVADRGRGRGRGDRRPS